MGSAAFSPDGRLVAYGWDDGKLRLIDARTGKMRRVLSPGSWVTHISFSPDGAFVATSGDEVPVKVWRVSTGKSVAVLPSSTVDVASIAFGGNDQPVVSANKDGTATVWDVATETAIAAAKGPSPFAGYGAGSILRCEWGEHPEFHEPLDEAVRCPSEQRMGVHQLHAGHFDRHPLLNR
jgi:WD40 repeat protein